MLVVVCIIDWVDWCSYYFVITETVLVVLGGELIFGDFGISLDVVLVVWCILVEIVDIGCTVVLGAICLDF
jgi:hypothetical protein